MEELILVTPSELFLKEILLYKKEFVNHDESMDGTAGLRDAKTVEEWLGVLKDNSNEKRYMKVVLLPVLF